MKMPECIQQKILEDIFPPEKSDQFFDAIYGGAEDGAYDIRLTCKKVTDNDAIFAFELRRREGKCLKCSLTYGLPAVFQRHPIININGVAKAISIILGWVNYHWSLGTVEEINDNLHLIPFVMEKD